MLSPCCHSVSRGGHDHSFFSGLGSRGSVLCCFLRESPVSKREMSVFEFWKEWVKRSIAIVNRAVSLQIANQGLFWANLRLWLWLGDVSDSAEPILGLAAKSLCLLQLFIDSMFSGLDHSLDHPWLWASFCAIERSVGSWVSSV